MYNQTRTKLVKCVVCGAIFDASLEICPVCKAGKDKFVPYEEETAAFHKDTAETFLILGNGVAGIEAAKAIRERNKSCKIIMVTDEESLSYNRPMLTKALSTLKSADDIAMYDREWYDSHKIQNVLGTKIEKLVSEEKMVYFADGRKQGYDKCIYALGSYCFIPPINGKDKPQVIAIRNIADVDKIGKLMPSIKNTVVIGGGVLGLEAAWEMSKKTHVTILEVADKLMVRQLDDEGGKFLGDIITKQGIDFRLNAQIEEITGEDKVTGVKLKSGEFYPADLVIVSSGVRPNTEVAQAAGIAIGRAVIVNEKMETNIKDVYACGDCAEYKGVNYAIWPEAMEMGRIAGSNAAGDSQVYENAMAALTFNGLSTSLFSVGDNGKNPDLVYTSEGKTDSSNYEKFYYVDGRLVGSILIGDTSKMIEVTKKLEEGSMK
ncbi:FAD-dependent oxidoreductase [Parasporobacterium paucivorans]|uniref:Pyridine nucleotide-disulphide oxidoreductase n=1 Tax=Parasporobacterium paucivorans DSM 15970 TaxID=1122934 RepID=A0A1M6AFS2_9FIRM|nr:FAD-dependent oxidoreductase [Parasporobacterium paucivorans]SHI35261.1 Pyridine nucleotide-disulphide oxidoreductase [Parasporobacterium paucivorans DSM 15970]